ncbi:hypothetical protein MKS88_000604 [Plasmodium brasilianum]|uniref:Uncharacterized protein n=1 Tax=Plasmodium brasilianum TaxID=5824 RepID=A0ACB9YFK6_PLABR|nr:hypothetical protein MKS88_000604 [Plasmodium brasilianum]
MEQKIKTQLFIKFTTLILLSWICYFYIKMYVLKKSFGESWKHHKRLYARTCRLLAKYKQNNDASSVRLKGEMKINGVYEKKDISYSEKDDSRKKKQSNPYLSNISGDNKGTIKNKSCTFETKKYSHLEKKIFKELDYTDFLRNNKTISNQVYNKVMRKKYGLRIVLPVLIFLFILIIFILEVSLTFGNKGSLLYQLGLTKEYLEPIIKESPWSSILEWLKKVGGFLEHSISNEGTTEELFITIKKLKNMKKLNSEKEKNNNKEYFYFCIDILKSNYYH